MELLGKVTSVSSNIDEKGIIKLSITLTSYSIALMKMFETQKMFNINSKKAVELFNIQKYNKQFTYETSVLKTSKIVNSLLNLIKPKSLGEQLSVYNTETIKYVTDVEGETKKIIRKEVDSAISLKSLFEEILPQLIEYNMKNYFLLNIINSDIARIETSSLLDKENLSLSPSASQYVGLPNDQQKIQ